MATPDIPIEDLDLETLLALAERMSRSGAVSLIRSTTGWACALRLIQTNDDFLALQWHPTPEEALVAAITNARP